MQGSLQGLELWLVILFPIIWNCWIITCQHRATYSRSASFQRFHMVETGNIQWRKLLSTDTILFPKYLSLDNCTHCLGLFRCDSFSDQGNERTPSFGMNHALHIWTTRTSTITNSPAQLLLTVASVLSFLDSSKRVVECGKETNTRFFFQSPTWSPSLPSYRV